MWYYYDEGGKNVVFYFRLMKILIKTANAYICVHDRRFIMVKEVNIRKVAVIGCGFVGSTSAYTLMQSSLFSEMVLIDADRAEMSGKIKQLDCCLHGLSMSHRFLKSLTVL